MSEVVSARARRLTVSRVVEETADARSLVFDVPQAERDAFRYVPGQYLTLRVPSERCGSVARCYSLASSPHRDEPLRVIVKRTADGYGSNWLCDHVEAGSSIEVLPPLGQFSPRSLDVPTVLLAAGSGVTPIMSIAASVLGAGRGDVSLIYANRDERSVILADDLRRLVAAHPDRLRVVHWLESVQGLPDAPALGGLLRPLVEEVVGVEVFVCGPAPFMAAAKQAARDCAVPRSSVHVETFNSLTTNPFEPDDAPEGETTAGTALASADAGGPPAGDEAVVEVEVEFEGETHALSWPSTRPLLEVMLEQGFDVPFMCRSGECGTCQATCETGAVRMITNDLLDAEDVADGYVLTCQLLPDGADPVRIVF